MPSIMELFGFGKGNSGAQTPTANTTDNTTVPSVTTPQSDGSTKAIPAAATGDKSPLEKYNDLWKADDKQPDPNAGTTGIVPSFNMDPTKLAEAAQKIDFLSGVPQEKLTEAMQNPEALRDLINNGLRNVFVNSATTSGNLIQTSMGNAQQVLQDRILPESYRTQAVQASLAENPVFQSAAVAPVVSMVREQLQRKHPTASAPEIASMAAEYLNGVATQVVQSTGNSVVRQPQGSRSSGAFSKRGETDWTTWLENDQYNNQR